MTSLPLVVLHLLLSLDPSQAMMHERQRPFGDETAIETKEIRIADGFRVEYTGSGPILVTLGASTLQGPETAPETMPETQQGEPVLREEEDEFFPADVRALLELQSRFLPPSDRVQVGLTNEELGLRQKGVDILGGQELDRVAGWDSMNVFDSVGTPPDPEIAVGPNHVVAVINVSFEIYDLSGSVVRSATTFESLLGVDPNCHGFYFDPNVLYDEQEGRFILGIAVDGTDYCFAVSQSDDPIGTWAVYSIPADLGGNDFDFPQAGIGQHAFYFGANLFDALYPMRLFSIDKRDLYELRAPDVKAYTVVAARNYDTALTPQPLHLHGAADGTWLDSEYDYFVTTDQWNQIVSLWGLEHPFDDPESRVHELQILQLSGWTGVGSGFPLAAPQTGSSDELKVGKSDALDFEYRNGYGWLAQTIACNPGQGTVNCLRWAQIDLANEAIVDAGVFTLTMGGYSIYPDLAVDRCGNMLVGFTMTGSVFLPDSWVAGRESDDAPGEIEFVNLHRLAEGPYWGHDDPPLRYGDYTGATVSPDGRTLWYIGEYSIGSGTSSGNWGNYIAAYRFPDDDDDGVPNTCDACPAADDTLDADGDSVPDDCDVCAGQDDTQDADGDDVPDACDVCWGDDDTLDTDNDGVCNDLDACPGFDDTEDADSDGVPDACDQCPGSDDSQDADSDGIPDACDTCAGHDDAEDADDDGVPDGCDVCPGHDDATDSDGDGIADGCDACFGDNASGNDDGDDLCNDEDLCFGTPEIDGDGDGVCDAVDACPGYSDSADTDGDGVANGCDACPGQDDRVDDDGDGVPDACDACIGVNTSGNDDGDAYCNDTDPCLGVDNVDDDGDGICNSLDICSLGDDLVDYDGDGIPFACDPCFGPDNIDSDGDGECDSRDECIGTSGFEDLDGDGYCEDLDCEDNDPDAIFEDRCGVCGGDNTSCFVLMAIGSEFSVASTTASDQKAPRITAKPAEGATDERGFLVTWTSADGDGDGIRGRLFGRDGTPAGDDFAINESTSGSQDVPDVTALADGTYVVSWQSADADGAGIAGRRVESAPLGSELLLNSAEANDQLAPRLASSGDGFLALWQTTGLDADASQGVAARPFDSLGAPQAGDSPLTAAGVQSAPDVAATPSGYLATWIDATSGLRIQPLDGSGGATATDVRADVSGEPGAPALAANASGQTVLAWADGSADGAGDAGVLARRITASGVPTGDPIQISPAASTSDQHAPEVAVLDDGFFFVTYQDDATGGVHGQVYESDGTQTDFNRYSSVLKPTPFQINDAGTATAPAVAIDDLGTFFVVWEDSAIDGSGSGIAGRLFGTDVDGDEIPGALDNCPLDVNANQKDVDVDTIGDACDACPGADDRVDSDGDATADGCDTCTDLDDDGYGDPGYSANTCATDNCPATSNPDQADADGDAIGDLCDTCTDTDSDGYGNPGFTGNSCADDNCPTKANASQADVDADGTGDACDTCTDTDDDGYGNPGYAANTCAVDNCPDDPNISQVDTDSDGIGDLCDTCTDSDDDGYGDGVVGDLCATDNCPGDANASQADADSDGIGDVCDTCTDTDDDGFGDPGYAANTCAIDNCPGIQNDSQLDTDGDGTGDVCDTCTDTDGDGFGNPGYLANTCAADNCPAAANASQSDTDGDGIGDACDTCTDLDGDGYGADPVSDLCATDNCVGTPNADQADADGDGIGDACDTCTDVDDDGICAPFDCDDGDPTNPCAVFRDGFESGDATSWSHVVG